MGDKRLYRIRHRVSKYRGRIVRLRIRPSMKRRPKDNRGHRAPNNVLAECVDTHEWFVCPWRGLRRAKAREE